MPDSESEKGVAQQTT